jgi:SNF2 family DNA or RNA helicase
VVLTLPGAAQLTLAQRRAASLRIKEFRDWTLPPLDWFNSDPCERHAPDLNLLCQRCGIELRSYQRVGAAWMYLGGPNLLSDTMGSGKTAQAIAVLAMCKQAGELSYDNRAVIVCKPAATDDPWASQLRRLAPGLDVFCADGDPASRLAGYAGAWEVAIVSDRTFTPVRGEKIARPGDVATLLGCDVGILIYDDTDAMRTPGSSTCRAVTRLADRVLARGGRVHGLHGTPLQKKLTELYSFLVPVGGRERLGTLARVKQRYVTQTRKIITVPDRNDPSGRRRARRAIMVENGITSDARRVAEFREAIAPLVMRRTAADLDGAGLPEVQVNPVFMDLLPAQRARYEELREGVLRRLRPGGEEITLAVAAAAFTRGQQICGGLAALDTREGADVSAKLDWVVRALTGDLAGEKAVCFVYHKGNVAALSERLRAERIGHVIMWSQMTDKQRRAERLRLFRENPRARVLIGTTTIEASLNLQVARHLIAVDTILNPARMAQLTGRIRRLGSPFSMVFLHQLLCWNTQEEGYLPLLRREQEVSDTVWDDPRAGIYSVLTPRQLMRMIATGRPGSVAA